MIVRLKLGSPKRLEFPCPGCQTASGALLFQKEKVWLRTGVSINVSS